LDFTIEESGFNPTLQNGVDTAADLDVKCSNRVFIKDRGITLCRKERSHCQYQELKDNQIGITGTSQANDLHDLILLSAVNVDDSNGAKSKIMTFRFMFIAT
jgi:hypothetical protein